MRTLYYIVISAMDVLSRNLL